MGIQGNLQDLAVADLIQQYCQDQKTARLTLERDGQRAELFIKDGNVVHAACPDAKGEIAVFQMLMWDQGAFTMESGIEPPETTISRGWSSLLMEGMRYQDEERSKAEQAAQTPSEETEEKVMAENLNDVLKEMSGEVAGYVSSALVGMDGLNIADHTAAKVDVEISSAQLSLFLQQVDLTVKKLEAGLVEENLITSRNAFVLMRYLSGRKFFLAVQADRKTGNLGNLRMITKVYANRLDENLPNNPKPKSKPKGDSGGPELIKSIFSFP